MTFITLLLCLSLERFLSIGKSLHRFNWLSAYVNKVQQSFGQYAWAKNPYIFFLLIVLPIVLLFALIYVPSHTALCGFVGFVLGAAVLFYCLGPDNIYESKTHHRFIFNKANETLFAVIFWFALLGPIAALTYRLVERCAQQASSQPALSEVAAKLKGFLDWLPVRLFTIINALVGNFMQTSHFFLNYLLRDPSFNGEMIERGSRIALGLQDNTELKDENYPEALQLIDRTLILFLLIVFAVTLGMLL